MEEATSEARSASKGAEEAPSLAPDKPHGFGPRALTLLRRMTREVRFAQIEQLRKSRAEVFKKAREIPDRVIKTANQLRLLIDLVEDFAEGRYRAIPWYSVAIAVAATLYFVSPQDLVPDWLPVLGQLDDIAVIAIALKLIRTDLIRYCEHRDLDPSLYF